MSGGRDEVIGFSGDQPDPLGFAARALESEGALAEVVSEGRRAHLVLPDALAARIGWPETVTLVRAGVPAASGDLVVGYGTPILDHVLDLARGEGVVCSLRLEGASPGRRDLAAEAGRAYRFHTRARIRFGDTEPSYPSYVVAHFALKATSEEVHESLLTVVLSETTLAPVPVLVPVLTRRLDAGAGVRPMIPERSSRTQAVWTAARQEAVRASAVVVQPFLAAMERRRNRDAHRLYAYFDALAREAAGRKRRGRAGDVPVEERVQAIAAEYARKVRDLSPRYTLRVSLQPLAAVRVCMPVLRGAYMFQWRTAERTVPVIWNPLLQACETLACERCGAGGYEFTVETGGPDEAGGASLELRCGDCAEGGGREGR